jgi:SAM-dependent methyltransferase
VIARWWPGVRVTIRRVADFDPTTPSIARVYDYLLNGKDNFAVDRSVAGKLLAVAPEAGQAMRENRQFLARATRWVAGQGVSQFIDLGCGMPTEPNTHGSAGAAAAEPRVAYVDTDPVVLAHLRALAAHGNEGVTVIDSDARAVPAILDAVAASIELSRPACLIMGSLLHFFSVEDARALVKGYVAALAPGSYLVASVGVGRTDEADKAFGAYNSAGIAVNNFSVEDFSGFFRSLTLVEPGIVDPRRWQPDEKLAEPIIQRSGQYLVGVARVD